MARRRRAAIPSQAMATAVDLLEQGQRVRVIAPGVPEFATVRFVTPVDAGGTATVFLVDDGGTVHEVLVGPGQPGNVRALVSDGAGHSARVLAGMWTRWMAAAATN